LHVANATAISNAAAVGICLRLGFVIGHLGMTPELLATSVACAKALINADSNAILSVDVELLSPEPGSQEFRYLTDPAFAELKACQLGLCIAERSTRERIASKWDRTDLIHRDEAITDYIEAMMPRLSVGEVVRARDMIRSHAMSRGILVGT
jgi:anaerobic magnesium-protoporphyrin IX monomethyl ester cyclase